MHSTSPTTDPSRILRHLPACTRPFFRRCKRNLLDLQDRAAYLTNCISGRDPWFSPDLRIPTTCLGEGDGRWTISATHLPRHPLVYSFGIGLDVSFDLALIERYGAEVYGFDPTPVAKSWLAQQNMPDSFHFVDCGLAAHNGELELALPPNHGVSFTPLIAGQDFQKGKFPVKTLSTFLSELGHGRVDIIKIDIEGAEYEIIDELAQCQDRIGQLLIEFHHRMFDVENACYMTRSAVGLLRAAGFKLFAISPRGLEFSFLRE
jgi:FkbM family methyltransferase